MTAPREGGGYVSIRPLTANPTPYRIIAVRYGSNGQWQYRHATEVTER